MRTARGLLHGLRARATAHRRAPALAGPRLLRAFADAYPAASFIEVGANDGDQHDHLRPLIQSGAWTGIMIEPVPYVFERLRANYGDHAGIALENVAIADRAGMLPFFHLAQAPADGSDALPPWYDAIGSFSLDAIMSHADKIPDLEARIVHTEVPSITFDMLCQKHGVTTFDLLLIDTEGYDWEILERIDLASYQPSLVIYEHYHLPAPLRRHVVEHLDRAGYDTLAEGFDTWCLRRDAAPSLRRTWRGLRPGAPTFSADENPA